jgi:predicted nucleic-acid-binding protein
MVAVDTNIIVRLLTQDDELQYQKSLEIFQTQNDFMGWGHYKTFEEEE